MSWRRSLRFPAPPVPGTAEIVPITTEQELFEEGRIQENCVASYADRIARDRRVYVYRVLLEERCTLAISRAGHRWVLNELARARNEEASEQIRIQVERWLGMANRRSA